MNIECWSVIDLFHYYFYLIMCIRWYTINGFDLGYGCQKIGIITKRYMKWKNKKI